MSKKRKYQTENDQSVAMPEDFIREMSEIKGIEGEKLVASLEEPPVVSLRVNRRKPLDALPYEEMEGVPWCASGYYLTSRPDFIHNPLIHAGTFYVQEAASMVYEQIMETLVANIASDAPLTVLDLCAAPGGKTTAVINALRDGSVIVANEIDRKRSGILKENLDKWGYPDTIITSASPAAFHGFDNLFDIVAADLPCSGEGLMRREPMARKQWSRKLVADCANLQRNIIHDVYPALKPGGYLIYSTCTYNLQENEENVRYLTGELGFEAVPLDLEGVGNGVLSLEGYECCRRFMPHKTGCEGLFVAVLRKPEESDGYESPRPKKNAFKIVKPVPEENALIKSADFTAIEMGNRIYAVSDETLRIASILARNPDIKFLSIGSEMLEVKGNLHLPSSKLPLSGLYRQDAVPMIEVNLEDALSYLRKEPVSLPSETPTGYITVSYRGYPLGLLKNLGKRSNNLYPPEWKLRS